MLKIKVLGPGCANCRTLETVTRKAVARSGVEAEIIKVQDYDEIMQYAIFSTPALVINEKIVSVGRVPRVDQVVARLSNAAAS